MNDVRLVCLDMDGTLILENSWAVLNTALGITPEEDEHMYRAYNTGTLSYDAWIARILESYRHHGKAEKSFIESALSQFTIREGAAEMVAYLKGKGYHVALISGSFDIAVQRIATLLRIPIAVGTTQLTFNEGGLLTNIQHLGDESHAKVACLKKICGNFGIELESCACLGDGGNDIELFKATGHGITFSASSQEIKKNAQYVIDSLQDIQRFL